LTYMLLDYQKVTICQGDKVVLSDVNLRVGEGQFIYIIGKVGSGKSSLLKSLYAELDIKEAEKAEVLGRNMLKLRRKEVPMLRREMGIIFQDFQLLADKTVYGNLDFVLKATGWKSKQERRERIESVLERVGMPEYKQKFPHELSGGEQQRIAIARAILNEPKIIIADEPTGNLDPETADHIIQLLKTISQTGTPVLMSTHNMPLLDKYPGIVYRCKDGRMSEATGEFNDLETIEKE